MNRSWLRAGWMIGIGLLGMVGVGESLPAFARQNGFACNVCHSAYPRLNPYGKRFRELGYSNTGSSSVQGPWVWKDFFPVAFQGIMGYTYDRGQTTDGNFSVMALQIFAGGAIAPGLVTYLHHHLVLNDFSGELHEAWIRWEVPRTPLRVTVGQFELPLASSPGKTILTHFGYVAYNATLGENPDVFADSKRGIKAEGRLGDRWRGAVVYSQDEGIRSGFGRLWARGPTWEVGVLGQYGQATLGDTLTFQDRYWRAGMDFDVMVSPRLETYGILFYGRDDNPHGDGDPGAFLSGFLQTDFRLLSQTVLALRVEHFRNLQPEPAAGGVQLLHTGAAEPLPERGTWVNVSLQHYLALNVKVIAEVLRDLDDPGRTRGILGAHYAF